MNVEISIKEYLQWAYEDVESLEGFLNRVFISGWKGVREEFKTIADLNIHGYLPSFIFVSGFEDAYEICKGDDDEITPDDERANEIEVHWVD